VVGHTGKAEFNSDDVNMASESFQKLVYREGNVFRLRDHRDGIWDFDIGIRVQEADLAEGILANNDIPVLCGVCEGGVEEEPLEPGRVYWVFEANWPEKEVLPVIALVVASGMILTATTVDLLQELGNIITAARPQGRKKKGSRYKLVSPEALPQRLSRSRQLPQVSPAVSDDGFFNVPSSAPLQTMLSGIQDAAEGAPNWLDFDETATPTYRHLIGRGGRHGVIDLSLRTQDGEVLARDTMLATLWDQVRELDDLTGDVLLAAFTQWLTRQEAGSTWITADAILDYRGIKPIMKKEGNSRRRAGHHWEHKAAIARAFEQLDHLWLYIDNMEVVELKGKRRRPGKLHHLESKAIAISDRISQGGLGGGHLPVAWHYRPGEWARPFLQEGFRQTALLAQQSLQYDPYRETWEKRLSRYFAFHWRIQAHQGNYSQPYRVDTLLKAISKEPNKERPNRTRERLEKALDHLQADGITTSWEYQKGDEGALPTKGWLPAWLNWTVEVIPPPEVTHHYASITRAPPTATLMKKEQKERN